MRTSTSYSKTFSKMMPFLALLLVVSMTGCGGGGGGTPAMGGPAPPVNLGTSNNFAILTKTSIVNTPTSTITGDIGVSPGVSSEMRGFDLVPLVPDATTVFSTSAQVTGKIFASDYASPTPANLDAAVASMVAAYTDAAGRPAGTLDLGNGTLSGDNLAPGTYTWNSFPNVVIKENITLAGTATDVWIFQIPGTLGLASDRQVNLAGGALAQNVFWQVADAVTIGTNAHFEGIILGQTSITLETGATMKGRALAQSGVTLDSNTITVP